MKRILILLIMFLSFSLNSLGQDFKPTREVEITDDGIIVTYRFQGGFFQEDPLHEGSYFWKIPGFALNDVAGEPAFPFHWDAFAIPDDVEVNVEVIDSAYTDTLFSLAPAYPPLLMNDTIGYTPERAPEITAYSGLYPRSAAVKGSIQSYRGQGLVKVATLPVQYNYQTHTVRSFSMIKYMVSFESDGAKVKGRGYASASAENNISPSDHFLENITLNYSKATNGPKKVNSNVGLTSQLDNRSYLIITTDNFLDAVNEFAEWKRTKGYKVFIESKSQGQWTYDDIHSRIEFYYGTNKYSYPLYHVLFVGDNDYVSGRNMLFYDNSESPSLYLDYISDYFYAINIGENNRGLPAVHRGRIPVGNNTEAQIALHKIINYEKHPTQDVDFYNNASVVSYFQNSEILDGYEALRMTLTSEEIRNHLLIAGKDVERIYKTFPTVNPSNWNFFYYSNGDTIPSELRRSSGFLWNGNAQDIVNSINDGRFLLIYNGHGSETEWQFFGFTNAGHVNQLNNSRKLPVVLSMACSTSGYQYSNDCLGESFIKNENGGCVAFLGSNNIAHGGFLDVYEEAMIEAIWPGLNRIVFHNGTVNAASTPVPTFELGQIMDQGLEVMSNQDFSGIVSNSRNFVNYEIEQNLLFGDPSMMIYTDLPVPLDTPLITTRNDSVFVELTDGNARISCHNNNLNINSYLGNYAAFKIGNGENLICVDRHNNIPYLVTVMKDGYIQNEAIDNNRVYVNSTAIMMGNNVTTTKQEGEVVIDGANMILQGGTVELHPGTTILNSNVIINSSE